MKRGRSSRRGRNGLTAPTRVRVPTNFYDRIAIYKAARSHKVAVSWSFAVFVVLRTTDAFMITETRLVTIPLPICVLYEPPENGSGLIFSEANLAGCT